MKSSLKSGTLTPVYGGIRALYKKCPIFLLVKLFKISPNFSLRANEIEKIIFLFFYTVLPLVPPYHTTKNGFEKFKRKKIIVRLLRGEIYFGERINGGKTKRTLKGE